MITAIVIILALILIAVCPSIIYIIIILACVALVGFAIMTAVAGTTTSIEDSINKNKTDSSNPSNDDPNSRSNLNTIKNLDLTNNKTIFVDDPNYNPDEHGPDEYPDLSGWELPKEPDWNVYEKETHEQETSETTAHERED